LEGYLLQKSAIVAWFTNQGYKLSAELLNYSFVNSSYGSIYVPNSTNTAKIKNTSWFQTAKNETQPGSSYFESNVDLRYGIHSFEYYFNYDFGTYKYMVISDLYDYTKDINYPTAAGVANNAMLNAQITGCLTPFTTTIYLVTQ